MTVARRRASRDTVPSRRATRDTIAAPLPPTPAGRPPQPAPRVPPGPGPRRDDPLPPGSVPVPPGDAPAPDAITPVGRLRRCTFRRVDLVAPLPSRPALPSYEVMCLYADADDPMPLGDVDHARPVCEACTFPGIFRADED